MEDQLQHVKTAMINLGEDLKTVIKRYRADEEDEEKLVDAWNTLIAFAGKVGGKTPDEIDAFGDGLGSYYDVDDIVSWPEQMLSILAWLITKEEE